MIRSLLVGNLFQLTQNIAWGRGGHVSLLLCHRDKDSIINLAYFCRVIYTEHFIRNVFIANSKILVI